MSAWRKSNGGGVAADIERMLLFLAARGCPYTSTLLLAWAC